MIVRFWDQARVLTCEVADFTVVNDLLAGRRTRQATPDSLWQANRTCDLVQLRSTAAGTTSRLRASK